MAVQKIKVIDKLFTRLNTIYAYKIRIKFGYQQFPQ